MPEHTTTENQNSMDQVSRPKVMLREITRESIWDCLKLELSSEQQSFLCPNAVSIAQAYVNRNWTPLAIFDGATFPQDPSPEDTMVGFVMYDVTDEVGYILRLMIGVPYQRQGFGRAAVLEVIRRLKRHPEVRMIATDYDYANEASRGLFASLGFVPNPLLPDREKSAVVVLDWPAGLHG